MKVRLGFVSNSSSSSYVIGVGRIVDENKFQEYCKNNKLNIDSWQHKVFTSDELIEYKNKYHSKIKTIDNKQYVVEDSFNGDEVRTEFLPDSKYFMSYYCRGDDSDFWNDDSGEYNYDIDSSFFDCTPGKIILNICEENAGIVNFDCSYGAGRNG